MSRLIGKKSRIGYGFLVVICMRSGSGKASLSTRGGWAAGNVANYSSLFIFAVPG